MSAKFEASLDRAVLGTRTVDAELVPVDAGFLEVLNPQQVHLLGWRSRFLYRFGDSDPSVETMSPDPNSARPSMAMNVDTCPHDNVADGE